MYDFGNAFAGLFEMVGCLILLIVLLLPLAIWKLIDIIIWLCNHIAWVN